jgi:hypothetical protein
MKLGEKHLWKVLYRICSFCFDPLTKNGMSNSHRGTSIDASYHVSVHFAKLFQRRRFLEIDQSETRIACGGHVCRNVVGSIYGRSSMGIAHSVLIR